MDILKKNFRNKFLIFTLCFTIIFSSLNINKSYADGGIISAPILATVVTAALGTGIVLKNKEEIYNMGRLFYDYVKNHNSIMWDTVVSAFESSVAFNSLTKQVTIGKEFGGILKGFFDDTFGTYDSIDSNSSINLGYYKGYPDITGYYSSFDTLKYQRYTSIPGIDTKSMSVGEIRWFSDLYYVEKISQNMVNVYNRDGYKMFQSGSTNTSAEILYYTIYYQGGTFYSTSVTHLASKNFTGASYSAISSDKKLTLGTLTFGLNYDVGTYNPGNVWGDTEEGIKDVPIYVPGDLSDLLNGNPGDVVGDKAPGWVGNGNVSLPTVDNPSIGVVDGSFPQTNVGNPSIPGTDTGTDTDINTGIWATIKDFVISLVVPSDTFWTDTWNGLYNNFVSAFPGVDMDNFNSLVTGEKKFPNIDINIMGVKGRVVNGDVVNSIVDWLRPIIAGFMMLCLMFFNYRKIYKLIRNSEPFGGISPGTSDFNARMSEYQGGK